MIRYRTGQSSIRTVRRRTRTLLLPIVALLAVSTMLGGCVIETPGHGHGGWWWHHHD